MEAQVMSQKGTECLGPMSYTWQAENFAHCEDHYQGLLEAQLKAQCLVHR